MRYTLKLGSIFFNTIFDIKIWNTNLNTFYISAAVVIFLHLLINCTNLENSQMLPISSQSLNGANSASRRAREVPKKGKSLEFNPKNYEQVKSSPSVKVWSHESVKDTVKFD